MDTGKIKQHSARKVYLEAARIISAFFVIFNHTGDNGFFLFSQTEWGSITFWICLFFSVFCKLSVPLFFMISGALMLHRENEPLGSLWKNRIGKNVLIIVLFAGCNYILDLMYAPDHAELKSVIHSVVSGELCGATYWYGHLWFLYAYIAYLWCLPFLRALVKNLDDRYFYYLMGTVLVMNGILPAVEYLISGGAAHLSRNLLPGWLSQDIVLYPCIGYFLEHRMDIQKQRNRIKWLWAADFAGIALTSVLIYREAIVTQVLSESTSQTFHDMFVLLNSIAIFVSMKYLFTQVKIPPLVEKAVLSVGRCTFGIYLIHIMVMGSQPLIRMQHAMLNMGINSLAACFIHCGSTLLISYFITAILRKIPPVRKLLG